MKALVAGSTGKTGGHIVRLLLEKGIEVRALVRDIDKANSALPETVEKVVGDVLNKDSLIAALAGCDILLSATGAAPSFDPTGPYQVDYEGNKNLVDAAKTAGVDQLVMVSSLCVSKIFHPLNLFWGILYWKKQAEDYLKASGVPYTIVRPGGLKDEDNAEAIVMSPADTLFEGSIPRVKVAQVCVDAIGQSAAKNKVLEIVTSEEAAGQPMDALFASVG
ncbi:SDR family oxidoreductase [cf. Phormidesmis sp. LEGE 11477]|uniref:SDR family oxidoreductase n=1 Tax=cf. Phormidesmis sp. LEGE 11477 TaxID=1828680 RepID=UPI00187EAE47|nr:SDR family oxidoreductase [cf. Phormidesmis sp. LEGE 11477]MBE9063622.1 SDR family oxidoreductase [cf. Phormidesmis sp. LEGE 11477]